MSLNQVRSALLGAAPSIVQAGGCAAAAGAPGMPPTTPGSERRPKLSSPSRPVKLTGRCRPSLIVFAEGSRAVAGAGSVSVTVKPTAAGLSALQNALRHKQALPLSVTLTFQSSLGGGPASHTQSLTVRLKKPRPKKS